MSVFKAVFAELRTPDDQGRDWYGWASNQMSHALLGITVALYFPLAPMVMAFIIGGLKECFDLLRNPSRLGLTDSTQDVAFWVMGAWLITATDHNLAVIAIAFALLCGTIPRIRKAKNV